MSHARLTGTLDNSTTSNSCEKALPPAAGRMLRPTPGHPKEPSEDRVTRVDLPECATSPSAGLRLRLRGKHPERLKPESPRDGNAGWPGGLR